MLNFDLARRVLFGFTSTDQYIFFKRFVDRVTRYNRVKKNKLDAELILSIFRQPSHVAIVCRPIIRRYKHNCTTICTYYYFQMNVS